jgi:3-hydroxybutyryl-CoA dehydrogenase
MKVVIAGGEPFLGEVATLCRAAGHACVTLLVEDYVAALESGQTPGDLSDVDVAIEVQHQSAETKRELLLSLSDLISPTALLLTSALTVSTTQAASWITEAQRVVGFGVLPPLPDQGVVEVAAGLQTESAMVEKAAEFWRTLNYEPIVVADGPGLVRARIVCCLINEAATALQEGVASLADIDQAMVLGTNYPRGPFAWADHLGLDMVLAVMAGLFDEWGEDRYRPAPLLRRMVTAGYLGKKTGRGFFSYT